MRAVTSPAAGGRRPQALAFDRAAALYRLALDLPRPATDARPCGPPSATPWRTPAAGPRPPASYLEAAAGESGAEVLELRRRAAVQYLISGHIDRGLATLRGRPAAVGMTLPGTPRRALFSLLLAAGPAAGPRPGVPPRDRKRGGPGRPHPDRRLLVRRGSA